MVGRHLRAADRPSGKVRFAIDEGSALLRSVLSLSSIRHAHDPLCGMTTSSEEPARDTSEVDREIRERAYKLWLRDGEPEGQADRYWNRARELLEDEKQSSYPPSQSRGSRS